VIIRARPSPNCDARPAGRAIDLLLLHYTGMPTAALALARLRDPVARVSAHYLIDDDGGIYQLVAEAQRAWHAGTSSWRGEQGVNDCSIGIELANPGHEFGYRDFPEPQMEALLALAEAVLARHRIPRERVLGHADVAPLRKQDPGERFAWRRLAAAGIGLWPSDAPAEPVAESVAEDDMAAVQAALAGIGYAVPRSGVLDEATRAAVAAFQRHWSPHRWDGEPDRRTRERLAALLRALP